MCVCERGGEGERLAMFFESTHLAVQGLGFRVCGVEG